MSDTPELPRSDWRAGLRRWLPTLLGLALAGAGVIAMGLAASGVRITVAPPETGRETVDPLDLLRDEVATIQDDVTRLGEGLGTNLEVLAEGLDARDAERSRALRVRAKTNPEFLAHSSENRHRLH